MKDTIKVYMFGTFRMEYNGEPLVADKMHKESQFNRLMQAILHYGEEGIAKDKLELMVFGESDIIVPHTSLRVIIYKAKQKLVKMGLPQKDFIYQKGGLYYWTPEIKIVEDAHQVDAIYEKYKKLPAEETDQRLQLAWEILHLYQGEFLAAYTSETWVAQESKHYLKIAQTLIKDGAEILRNRKDWNSLEDLGIYSSKVNPLNNWEVLTMEALVESRRYEEASTFYSKVVDHYLKECGIYPSTHLMEILERYSNQMNHSYEVLDNIQTYMDEEKEPDGGYYCSYPVFRGIYQTSARYMNRSEIAIYLMLCTIVDAEGKQLCNEDEMEKFSGQLHKCIRKCIRRNDVFTNYGKVQYLILLADISEENCKLVQNRINDIFHKNQPKAAINYNVSSVVTQL